MPERSEGAALPVRPCAMGAWPVQSKQRIAAGSAGATSHTWLGAGLEGLQPLREGSAEGPAWSQGQGGRATKGRRRRGGEFAQVALGCR